MGALLLEVPGTPNGASIHIFSYDDTKMEKTIINCLFVFIPSPVRVGTLLLEVPGTPNGASIHIFSYDFFEFELKLTGKDSADPTQ